MNRQDPAGPFAGAMPGYTAQEWLAGVALVHKAELESAATQGVRRDVLEAMRDVLITAAAREPQTPPAVAPDPKLIAERDAYMWGYGYLQDRMLSIDRPGWARDGEIAARIAAAAPAPDETTVPMARAACEHYESQGSRREPQLAKVAAARPRP